VDAGPLLFNVEFHAGKKEVLCGNRKEREASGLSWGNGAAEWD
jgi:hypothetical protein